ncbi:hypothetical protein PLESTB_001763400 [Pleodorina starrii]|uniref:Uncharacterized protein n=1 Tax=Pleodorina starrii TaxID=330485 RepID=A0A9W6C089_9CHLO|nr:hypothetical protein PLESTM_002094400 [Pleodorina starrii]GLC61502.1 hypothetical protein PLESTB_001763400 [Pleodorina starrii]GLC77326.1 hypothetical protein PLESTF_001919900 [Pleodorina starrii]
MAPLPVNCQPGCSCHRPAAISLQLHGAASVPVAARVDLLRRRVQASAAAGELPNLPSSSAASTSDNGTGLADPENFCIIENSETVKDFANLQLDEISQNIQSRRNRIFLLMEEVRRLRIQQRLKGAETSKEQELSQEKFVSALPFLPPLSEKTLNTYYTAYASMVAGIIAFGALVAPILEVKLGLGGTSYLEFVQSMHLPRQLAQVDPIVASFCGGAVGVLSALLVVEMSNIEKQQKNRCFYCDGTGYLMCGHCVGSGLDPVTKSLCPYCAGSSKVMCTSCLCTGKQLATEHDPRIDPF